MNKNHCKQEISDLVPTEKTMEAGCPTLSFTSLAESEF